MAEWGKYNDGTIFYSQNSNYRFFVINGGKELVKGNLGEGMFKDYLSFYTKDTLLTPIGNLVDKADGKDFGIIYDALSKNQLLVLGDVKTYLALLRRGDGIVATGLPYDTAYGYILKSLKNEVPFIIVFVDKNLKAIYYVFLTELTMKKEHNSRFSIKYRRPQRLANFVSFKPLLIWERDSFYKIGKCYQENLNEKSRTTGILSPAEKEKAKKCHIELKSKLVKVGDEQSAFNNLIKTIKDIKNNYWEEYKNKLLLMKVEIEEKLKEIGHPEFI